MKILILSRTQRYYATRRLAEAARKAGHKVKLVDPLKYTLVSYKLDKQPDVVIPRIGNIALEYSLALVKQFELAGVKSINKSESIYLAKDKFVSLQVLQKNGLPIPETLMVRNKALLKKAVRRLGGLPIVLKLLRGSQGIGVRLAKTTKELFAYAESTWALDHDFIVQRYYPESRGEDIRIIVIGNDVIASMKRYPRKGDFRSNIHQGGWAERIKLSSSYKTLAGKAVKALGLDIAGVDIIETKSGPLIIEVNASPGFEGMEKVTGLDIAGKIISFTVSRNKRRR